MGSLAYLAELYERSTLLQKERNCSDFYDSAKYEAYRATLTEVEEDLENEGTIPLEYFHAALFGYLNSSIEQILCSDQTIVRALGMFDKRLGKRRLKKMDVSGERELVQNFFRIRCAFENISPIQTLELPNL